MTGNIAVGGLTMGSRDIPNNPQVSISIEISLSAETSQQTKMEIYTMDAAKTKMLCCVCSAEFYLRDNNHTNIEGRIPYILKCGHSSCENCITTHLTPNCIKEMVCNICGEKFDLTPDEARYVKEMKDFKTLFPINFTVLGMLYYNMRKGPQSIEFIYRMAPDMLERFVKFKPRLENSKKKCESEVDCIECKKGAEFLCKQCGAVFCNFCFTKLHSFVSMKDHIKIQIGNEKYLIGIKKCEIHPQKILEFYCSDCSKNICVSCMITAGNPCRNHSVAPLKEENPEFEKELNNTKTQLVRILNNMKQTKKIVEIEINQKPACSFRLIKNKIIQHFGKLQAAIQAKEFNLIDTLTKYENQKYGLCEIQMHLNKSESEIADTIKAIDMSLDPKYDNEINIKSIVAIANENLNTPWFLSKITNDIIEPEITLNNNILENLADYCKLSELSFDHYKLLSTPELPPNTELSNVIESDLQLNNPIINDDTKLQTMTTNTSVVPEEKKELVKGSVEKVFVSHINNPQDFYVQRLIQKPLLDKMTASLQNTDPLCTLSEDSIIPGAMFVTLNKKHNEWHRITIIGLIMYKEENGILDKVVMVKYVDFGHTGEVNVKSIVAFDPEYTAVPPLAINCSLFNCKPVSGSWKNRDNILMLQMVNGKCCFIKAISKIDSTMEVELTTFSNKYKNDVFSINEALLFHACAKLVESENFVNRVYASKIPYLPKLLLRSNDEILITDVKTPSLFYVRRTKSETSFAKLCEDLNTHYSMKDEVDMIFTPKRGMIVACCCDKLKWRRARVEEVINVQKIKVYLVDSGNRVTVQWTALRPLDNKFFNYDEMAIKCCLYGIKAEKTKWSVESINFLTDCKKGKVKVLEKLSRNGVFTIILSCYMDNDVVSLNDEMVNRGYAVSSTKKNKDSVKIKVLNRPNVSEEPINVETVPAVVDDKLYVKILSACNPSTVYVTILSEEEELANLIYGLQEHYKNSEFNPDVKWSIGDKCTILSVKSNTWHRAAITAIDEDHKIVKVFLKDNAMSEEGPIKNLREVSGKFLSVRNGAIRCHLTGILPANGTNWPNITCEYIQEITRRFEKFYIVKDGLIVEKSLPVKLWVYHKTEGGALEPMIREWRNVNDMIVEQGLAIRILNESTSSSSPVKKESEPSIESAPDDVAVPNIVHKIVADWLPSPLPEDNDFTGIPTHVDDDMNIYIHIPSMASSQLAEINETLAKIFDNSVPQPNDIFWYPGQPCIVQYHIDRKYYRGKVIEIVANNNVSVLFVDYGNVETCPISTLRKNVVTENIPVQVIKCKIAGIKPIGDKWDDKVLDFVHANIVENKCKTRLLGKSEDGTLYVKLKIGGLINVLDLLIMNKHGEYDNYPKLIPVIESIEDVEADEIGDSDDIIEDTLED